jgi:hypothetical protein
MKKLILITLTSLTALCLIARAQQPNSTAIFDLSPGVTNVAASSTNTTAGSSVLLPMNGIARTLMIQARAAGIPSSTNGVSAVSNIVFRLSISMDGTNYTDSSTSPYKVTVPAMGFTTNWNADWMYAPGIRGIRVDRIENNTLGSVSNLLIWGSYNY